jgi:ATP adenylyltransferase
MDALWAPWRMRYIQAVDDTDNGCVFCKKAQQNRDRENLILYRAEHSFVVLNLYPYNNGHLMVIPYRHAADITELDEPASAELWRMIVAGKEALANAFHPDGFNIGMNLGRPSGAGIDQHIHMHIVPRWNGDTNFMPVVGETKVISQSLEDAYDALRPHFDNLK